jgi:hypothetical protein
MSNISPTLLNDTLQLVQLAREVALSKGAQAQADRLSPVVKDLRTLVNKTQETHTSAAPTGILAQNDFQTLLQVAQKKSPTAVTYQGQSSTEKSQMVQAMAAGNMSEVEIARQLGMTREEVRLVLSLSKNNG